MPRLNSPAVCFEKQEPLGVGNRGLGPDHVRERLRRGQRRVIGDVDVIVIAVEQESLCDLALAEARSVRRRAVVPAAHILGGALSR